MISTDHDGLIMPKVAGNKSAAILPFVPCPSKIMVLMCWALVWLCCVVACTWMCGSVCMHMSVVVYVCVYMCGCV